MLELIRALVMLWLQARDRNSAAERAAAAVKEVARDELLQSATDAGGTRGGPGGAGGQGGNVFPAPQPQPRR